MVTTQTKNSNNAATDSREDGKEASRDQMLVDIRSSRRLARIVESIQNFLTMQVTQVEQAVAKCEAAVENDIRVQQLLAGYEREKRVWEEQRQNEIVRLSAAGDELARAWEQLENERRAFLDSKTAR